MNVILCKEVSKLGTVGDVVKVKEGFARNYLIPRKLAYPATTANIKRIEQQKLREKADYQKKKNEAQELADKISKVSCTLAVEVNDLERMYGSVTDADIAKALEAEGFSVDKNSVVLENPITELGIYEVSIKVFPEVMAKVRVWVTKK